jgi:outer membrane protein assembly factor BamD (BamD/ComL family)
MNRTVTRPLKAFLCHASGDKPAVREMYKRLVFEGVDAWLDKEKLLPGQDWRVEIPKAVREADVVIVFLSKNSITREGYVQKEIKDALDIAEEKPDGTIFLIPSRLEECPVPERLSRWQWVDLFEDNGFVQLLRSLKLRAKAVGATVEPTSYQESDSEIVRRVEQLYTEGLAAFYTEEWDRACQRFQKILSEYPNHKNAAEKLAEAERQRNLVRLYVRAEQDYKAENWQSAIQSLEELLQRTTEYKDAAQLLRTAKKQKRLMELYAEAKALHTAQKWQAVTKVFEQISAIDPTCPDPDGLLPSAQKEVAELKRIADLNEQYRLALRKMDAGQWLEARTLLEKVHKSQTGFLETERLLRKAEDEIMKVEEQSRRRDQVNLLYEQAHGLIRSKNWRQALSKMEEIQQLNSQFEDKDGINERARAELAREEQEIQRQNELSAMYAESVRLMQEGKYQEALDKWDEVRTIDPKYPDRQWVQRTAKKKLAELTKPVKVKSRFVIKKSLWKRMAVFVVIALGIVGIVVLIKFGQQILSVPTTFPKQTAVPFFTSTKVLEKISTPRPVTAIPVTGGYADPTMYDDFDNPAYEGKVNAIKWGDADFGKVHQENGLLMQTVNGYKQLVSVGARVNSDLITKPMFVETRVMLDPDTTKDGTDIALHFGIGDKSYSVCSIFAGKNMQEVSCWSNFVGVDQKDYKVAIDRGTWHVLRIEMYPDTMTFVYLVDNKEIGSYVLPDGNRLRGLDCVLILRMNNWGESAQNPVGYFDYARMGAIEDDPTLYDDFNNSADNGEFDTTKWAYEKHDPDGSAVQKDGVLVFTQDGINKSQILGASNYWPLKLQNSLAFEANLESEMTNDGFVVLKLSGDVNASCGLHSMSDLVMAHCWTRTTDPAFQVAHRTWHTVRMEVNLDTNTITFYMDGKKLAEDRYKQSLKGASVYLDLHVDVGPNRVKDTRPMVGYVDNVRILPLR